MPCVDIPSAYPRWGPTDPVAAGFVRPDDPNGALRTAPARPTNTLAIIALVLGFVVPIGGVVVGLIALPQLRRTGEAGRGLAITGIVAGAVISVFSVLPVLLMLPELIRVFG
ncbi:DUF4190 domain-containing protein [Curtobacterium citreum]|uniref:DUF4190 domain-containing protein n=1 Tax=Curtobacterium citreum TaxID=2036 RepID=A0ABU8YDC8_9MICO